MERLAHHSTARLLEQPAVWFDARILLAAENQEIARVQLQHAGLGVNTEELQSSLTRAGCLVGVET